MFLNGQLKLGLLVSSVMGRESLRLTLFLGILNVLLKLLKKKNLQNCSERHQRILHACLMVAWNHTALQKLTINMKQMQRTQV